MKKISLTLNRYFTQNDLKIVLICVFIRVFLFSLYDYKVSECPDSWAFNHFSEKLSEYGKIYFHKQFDYKKKNVKEAITESKTIDVFSDGNSAKKGTFVGERSPGYPLFIFISTSKFITVLLQFLLGIITALLWYRTLLKLKFSSKFSFFIVILLQCCLSIFIYETFILVEASILFFISIISYHISDEYLTTEKSLKFEIYFSAILGYLVLIKPFYVVIPCILFALKFINKPSFKIIINRKLIIVIVPLLVFFGWSLVVQKFTGYYASTTYFGLNKAQNCVYFAEKGPKEYNWIIEPYVKHREIAIKERKDVSMSIWFALNSGEFKHKNMDFPELSNEFGKYADMTIKNNFSDYIDQVVSKSWFDFWKVFNIKELIKFDNSNVEVLITSICKFQNFIITIFKFLFLIISLFYFYLFITKKIFNFEFIISAIIWCISIAQGIVTYGTNSKYSFPFEYLMLFVILLFVKEHFKFFTFSNKSY